LTESSVYVSNESLFTSIRQKRYKVEMVDFEQFSCIFLQNVTNPLIKGQPVRYDQQGHVYFKIFIAIRKFSSRRYWEILVTNFKVT
jgi:hypothetical protein